MSVCHFTVFLDFVTPFTERSPWGRGCGSLLFVRRRSRELTGTHGIHCTKTARFLRTSNKDYFVRDRKLLWAYLLFSSTSSFFLLDSYRMTRKYLFFEFNNFFSDQWPVFYGIFRLHVTCTIKTQQNYELQILHAIYMATFFLSWNWYITSIS